MGKIRLFYTDGYIVVEKRNKSLGDFLCRGLKVNQQVRVYGDYLWESLPPKTNAYAIEWISAEESKEKFLSLLFLD